MSKIKKVSEIATGVLAANVGLAIAVILLIPLWVVAKALERLDARK